MREILYIIITNIELNLQENSTLGYLKLNKYFSFAFKKLNCECEHYLILRHRMCPLMAVGSSLAGAPPAFLLIHI